MSEKDDLPEIEMVPIVPEPALLSCEGDVVIWDIYEFCEATDSFGGRMNEKGEVEVLLRDTLQWVAVSTLKQKAKKSGLVPIR